MRVLPATVSFLLAWSSQTSAFTGPDKNWDVVGSQQKLTSNLRAGASADVTGLSEPSRERFRNVLPDFIGSNFVLRAITNKKGDTATAEIRADPETKEKSKALDKLILTTLTPSIINMMVVPLVNSISTFWVGQMGNALALAGQAAANQAFFVLFFLISFLPTITAPLVAQAIGAKNSEGATDRVCEALFLSNAFGLIGTILLVAFPEFACSLVLNKQVPAAEYAIPYLRWRGLSMVPALISAIGFAAYRGLLDTVTPLKVSLFANGINVCLLPLLIMGSPKLGIAGVGMCGAAMAASSADIFSGLTYLRLLFKKNLVRWSRLFKAPKFKSLFPLLKAGSAMLIRQAVLNISFVSAARKAQSLDPTGVLAAGYGITMQIYSLGIVMHLAVQASAATLVSSAKAGEGGVPQARKVADRIFGWGALIGILQACFQLIAMPKILPVFSTLPEVIEAAKFPSRALAVVQVLDGIMFAGEGTMIGLGKIRDLAIFTCIGVGAMLASLASPLGQKVEGIILSIAAFHLFQAIAVVFHHLRIGPLRRGGLTSPEKTY